MHIACYARKGRSNQLVIQFTDEEHVKFEGKKWIVSQATSRLFFDEVDDGGIIIGPHLRLRTYVIEPFGKTELTGRWATKNTLEVLLAGTKHLRRRRTKLVETPVKRTLFQRAVQWLTA
jgi:hypothetical protein